MQAGGRGALQSCIHSNKKMASTLGCKHAANVVLARHWIRTELAWIQFAAPILYRVEQRELECMQVNVLDKFKPKANRTSQFTVYLNIKYWLNAAGVTLLSSLLQSSCFLKKQKWLKCMTMWLKYFLNSKDHLIYNELDFFFTFCQLSVDVSLISHCFLSSIMSPPPYPPTPSCFNRKSVDDFTGPRERSDLGFITFDLSADILQTPPHKMTAVL